MTPLDYKGWKSTRASGAIALFLTVTAAYIWGDVTADQWLEFLKWDFMIYAGSEVGAKASAAYKEK